MEVAYTLNAQISQRLNMTCLSLCVLDLLTAIKGVVSICLVEGSLLS